MSPETLEPLTGATPEATPEAIHPTAILAQLNRLTESSLFNHSRRYPGFLRYVVDEALKGHQDQLKERSIGIDVFGRPADYDLNIDPVVRVTAGEVRKRLAQYYYEDEHRLELRIELKPGSYIPEFRLPTQATPPRRPSPPTAPRELTLDSITAASAPSAPVPSLDAVPPSPETQPVARRTRRLWAGAASLIILALAAVTWRLWAHAPSSIDRFWQPVLNNPSPVLITVGSLGSPTSNPGDISIASHARTSDAIALADTITVANIQQLLSQHNKSSLIQTSRQTSFSDLQRGSVVLISGFDNRWTLRLTDPLRFHFVIKGESVLRIEDRQNPQRTDWQIDNNGAYNHLTHDYAIVARFHDPTTEQRIVVAAGIGEDGTIAAGKMLTSSQFLDAVQWGSTTAAADRNMEAVIETEVIDGKSGPPRIVAIYFW